MQPFPSVKISQLLERIAEELDISDSLYEDAVIQYEDVAAWLSAEDSSLAVYSPSLYPQGSFRLGTVVRPLTHEDHYDIDLVCRLVIAKENVTQDGLKDLVGDRLKERADLKEAIEESRRCWRLNLGDHFHLDTLPSIPNLEALPNGILLTDTDLTRWQRSNPIAFADWFRDRTRVMFERRRSELAKAINADVEAVPDWSVKPPLQRSVQLLKRHRDIYFQKDLDNRPVSIILTTLAAKAYGNEEDLFVALTAIINGMRNHVTYKDGKYYVLNPVEPGENFADKWNEYPQRRVAFFAWLDRVRTDFGQLQQIGGRDTADSIGKVLGTRAVNAAAKAMGLPTSISSLAVESKSVPALGGTLHVQKTTWPEKLTHKVRVHGGIYLVNRKGKKMWDLTSRELPKNVTIKFSAETSVKPPFEIQWQVVNSGREAEANRDLRGGFYAETGLTHWETTRYAGTHWVEAFVVKEGVCLARSGRVLIKIRG